jgi:hypothetical protein
LALFDLLALLNLLAGITPYVLDVPRARLAPAFRRYNPCPALRAHKHADLNTAILRFLVPFPVNNLIHSNPSFCLFSFTPSGKMWAKGSEIGGKVYIDICGNRLF